MSTPIAKRWPSSIPLPGIDDVYRRPNLEHHAAMLGFQFGFVRRWFNQARNKSVMQAYRDGWFAEIEEDFSAWNIETDSFVRLDRALSALDATAPGNVRVVYA